MVKDIFELEEYKRLISEEKYSQKYLEKAIKYKNRTLKKQKIYKFMRLQEIPSCEKESNKCGYHRDRNNRNIENIKNNKLWLSKYWNLNDPFEFNKIYISDNKENKYRKQLFELIRENFLFTCFSRDIKENLPMWAHYANNHNGFCVEYEINNPKLIIPVIYENYKGKVDNLFGNYINLSFKENKTIEEKKQLENLAAFIIQCFSYKNTVWKYEKELRLFMINDDINLKETKKIKGKNFSLEKLGISITGIYLGINFIDEYKDEFVKICKDKDIKLYKMYIDQEREYPYLDFKEEKI